MYYYVKQTVVLIILPVILYLIEISNNNKSNSMAGAVQVKANMQKELCVHLHFTKLNCC